MIVEIKDGRLKGKQSKDYDGNEYFSFLGIPYAKPPVGNLRFKAPQPVDPWKDVRDATKEGDHSLCRDFVTGEAGGSEDCLFLNVFTRNLPNEPGKGAKPVMVWIHGGGFLCGSGNSDIYGPEHLMIEDIVLVTFNYRLGILGFLSLEDETLDVPGNAGLKDMVLVLKWVQTNISKFGGDPSNVTIFGHSAGGASVTFLLLSPVTKGLFHRAIAFSGTALNPWAFGSPCGSDIAATLGFNATNDKEILEFLQKQPAEKFLEVQDILRDAVIASKRRYHSPVVEKNNPTALLIKHPLDLLRAGTYNKVPLILGYTSEESIFFNVFKHIMIWYPITNLVEAVPYELGTFNSKESRSIAEKMKKFYFGNKDPAEPESNLERYRVSSDTNVVKDVVRFARLFRSTSSEPVYLYRFSMETQLNLFKSLAKVDVPGASHGDELAYIFKTALNPEIPSGCTADKCIRRLVKLLTNFARYGTPTLKEGDLPVWEPLVEGGTNYYEIGNELKMNARIPEHERIAFWEEIYGNKMY